MRYYWYIGNTNMSPSTNRSGSSRCKRYYRYIGSTNPYN